jgi:hypothetical protein
MRSGQSALCTLFLLPYLAVIVELYASSDLGGCGSGERSIGAIKRCKPPIRTLVSRLRSVSSLICPFFVVSSSRRNATSPSNRSMYFAVRPSLVASCRDLSVVVDSWCRLGSS